MSKEGTPNEELLKQRQERDAKKSELLRRIQGADERLTKLNVQKAEVIKALRETAAERQAAIDDLEALNPKKDNG